MPRVYQLERASCDLVEHFIYLAENASLVIAERFLEKAEASFDELASSPLMGAPLTLRNPELADMLKLRVEGFDNILIFYVPHPDGVSIVRVLHAAQDWWGLFGIVP